MRRYGTILCAVPADCFASEASNASSVELLRRFLGDIRAVERRLQKGVAVDDERLRHGLLSRRIEEVALGNAVFAPTRRAFARALTQGAFPALRVGGEYLDVIQTIHLRGQAVGPNANGRVGASVFSPTELAVHVDAFDHASKALGFDGQTAIRHRLWFLRRRVLPAGCGLVEVPDALGAPRADEEAAVSRGGDGRSLWERLWAWLRGNKQPSAPPPELLLPAAVAEPAVPDPKDWMRYGDQERGRFMQDRLRSQIEEGLTRGVPVNLSNQRHNMATEVLAEFIHRREGEKPASIPLVYNQGHEARPFPLRCLEPLPDGWSPTREFHVGLVSMRHLPIDQYIDINWYRNAEMSSSGGLAGADEAAFQASLRQFALLLRANRGHRVRLHVYHTGFVPAVVGFYRALVTTLSSGDHPPGCIQILPKLQPKGSGHVEGAAWPR